MLGATSYHHSKLRYRMANRLVRALLATAAASALIAGASATAMAQNPTVISGRIVNEAGTPIAGAQVGIEGQPIGTQSGDQGRYTLTVPGNLRGTRDILVRFIGYRPERQTVTLAGEPLTLDWTLRTQVTQLQGVVVTALSMQREKATISTSQQEVSAAQLDNVPTPNIISALSGKVSGLVINQNGNMGGSSRIVIRGA